MARDIDAARKTFRSGAGRALGVIAGATILFASAGCLERDPNAAAISEARTMLIELEKDAAPEHRARVYSQIVSRVQPALQSDSEDISGAAALITAEAELGLSTIPMHRASEAEHRVIRKAKILSTKISGYSLLDAEARAAAAYDPTDELAELRAIDATLDEGLATAQAALAAAQSDLAGLRAEADRNLSEASGYREQAGELLLEAAGASATEAADLTARARDLSRQADRLELAAELLQARIDRGEPLRDSLRRDISAAEERIAANRRSINDAVERGERSEEIASEARAEANALADDIADLFEQMITAHTSEAADAAEEAMGHIDRATSLAGRARRAYRDRAPAVIGNAAQQKAALLRARISGLDAITRSVRQARAVSALPARIAGSASELSASLATAQEDLAEALQTAEDELIAAGFRERTREDLEPALDREGFEDDFSDEDAGFDGGPDDGMDDGMDPETEPDPDAPTEDDGE